MHTLCPKTTLKYITRKTIFPTWKFKRQEQSTYSGIGMLTFTHIISYIIGHYMKAALFTLTRKKLRQYYTPWLNEKWLLAWKATKNPKKKIWLPDFLDKNGYIFADTDSNSTCKTAPFLTNIHNPHSGLSSERVFCWCWQPKKISKCAADLIENDKMPGRQKPIRRKWTWREDAEVTECHAKSSFHL